MQLNYTLIPSPNGFVVDSPSYASEHAAGIDLRACIDAPLAIEPDEIAFIPLGVALEIPYGYFGILASRSSLGVKHGVSLTNGIGVIDADYRGEVRAILINRGSKAYIVQPNERLVQIIITPYLTVTPTLVDTLTDTERGGGGYGSTGKF